MKFKIGTVIKAFLNSSTPHSYLIGIVNEIDEERNVYVCEPLECVANGQLDLSGAFKGRFLTSITTEFDDDYKHLGGRIRVLKGYE